MRAYIKYLLPLIGGYFLCLGIQAQNNVGIGTKTPDLTAIMHLDDSTRGLLIPRTDTQSVWNYVNSLVPNPGIAHGLTIFEINMRAFYVYSAIKNKWEPISNVYGPRGDTGVMGPTGPRGPLTIATQWRDSSLADPVKRNSRTTIYPKYIPFYGISLGDSCGDIYHETVTGFIWTFDCTSMSWVGPIARWRNFGVPKVENLQAKSLITADMASGPTDTALIYLNGLRTVIKVPPDTIAYVNIVSEGVVRKTNVNDTSFNTVKFDFFMKDDNGTNYYLNKAHTVGIYPNKPPIPPSLVSLFDKVPWNIATTHTFEGKISPPGNPLAADDYRTWTIETHYRQLFTPGNPTGASGQVIIVDGKAPGIYESFAVMNVYIVFERSKNAPHPQ